MSTNDNIEGTDSHTIQLKRKLIPIELYAAQEGITRQMIEEYARLGIIQIRRHQGKSYVVELPDILNPFDDSDDTSVEQINPVDFSGSVSSEKTDTNEKSIPENTLPTVDIIQPPTPAEIPAKKKDQLKKHKTNTSSISENVPLKAEKIKSKNKQKSQHVEISSDEILQIMTEKPEKSKTVIGKMTGSATKGTRATSAKSGKPVTNRISTDVTAKQLIRFRQLDTAAQEAGLFRQSKKMPWQIAVLSIAAVIIISLSASIAYNTRRNIRINKQRQQIEKAYAGMGALYDDSRQANQKLSEMQQQFDQAQQEIVTLQDQLQESVIQANVSRNQLYQTLMDYEKEKAENEYRTRMLTEKIEFLLDQLNQSNQ
jgi:hypothetical protein